MRTLGRAAERHPNVPMVYVALGRLWLQTADRDEDSSAVRKALAALKPAADDAHATSEALALYGRALYLAGDVTRAERTLQRATTQMPLDPMAFRYLGDAARRLGHVKTAHAAEKSYAALTGL
jgi:predicted Zn-dependent protease